MKTAKLTILVLCVFFAKPSMANDLTVALSPVRADQIDRCFVLKSGVSPVFLGDVNWKSSDKKLGMIKKKNETIAVYSAQNLGTIFKQSLKETLTRCGFALSDNAPHVRIDADIDDFFIKTENDGVVGKGDITSEITLILTPSGQETGTRVSIGVDNDVSTTPFAQKKRFEKLLNKALVDLHNQIAMSRDFYEMVAASSGVK